MKVALASVFVATLVVLNVPYAPASADDGSAPIGTGDPIGPVYADCEYPGIDADPGRYLRTMPSRANGVAMNESERVDMLREDLLPQHVVTFDSKYPEGLELSGRFLGARVIGVFAPLCFALVETDDESFVNRASSHPGVVGVDNNRVMISRDHIPNDPKIPDQYGLMAMRVPEAWDSNPSPTAKTACVVDDGLYLAHEELGANYLGGIDYTPWPNSDTDPSVGAQTADDHGTAMASIIGAAKNNAKGIAGFGVKYKFARVAVTDDVLSMLDQWAAAITWCKNNANVISMSLSVTDPSTVLENAVNNAVVLPNAALVVASAGNRGNTNACNTNNCVGYPAKYSSAIAVSCFTKQRAICFDSSRGPEIDFAAPAQATPQAWVVNPSSYRTLGQTSEAAALVAGATTFLWSVFPTAPNGLVRMWLEQSAQPVSGNNWFHGWGLIDLEAAVEQASGGIIPSGYQNFCDRTEVGQFCAPWTYTEWVTDMDVANIVNLGDDAQSGSISINPGFFTFVWFGVPKTSFKISSNGYICFEVETCTSRFPQSLPNTGSPNDLVSCFWDDLNPSNGGRISWRQATMKDDRKAYVIEYAAVPHFGNKGGATFQIQLLEDTETLTEGNEVRCVWMAASNGPASASVAVGTESAGGVAGSRHMFKDFRAIGQTLRIYNRV